MPVRVFVVDRIFATLRVVFTTFSDKVQLLHQDGIGAARGVTPRFERWRERKKMKKIHFLFSSYKTKIFRKIIRVLNKCVINKSCV
jgi:hypothetical protein